MLGLSSPPRLPDDTAHGEGGLHEGVLEADLARRHGLVEGR